MPDTRRPTAHKWRCSRSGDCCLNVDIRLTVSEGAALQAATSKPLLFNTREARDGWLRLTADGACPLLQREADGSATCTAWESRPYQCRRFMCGRPDPSTEPYEIGGPMGCKNLSDRIDQSLHFAEFYRTNQRHAQREWAIHHGWHKGMA